MPQFCLQLFVLGRFGEYDAGFRYALLAEGLFVLYGIVYFIFSVNSYVTNPPPTSEATKASKRRDLILLLLFIPWSILFLLSCVPLMLFASLYTDASLQPNIAVIIYYMFHLVACVFFYNVITKEDDRGWVQCLFGTLVILGMIFSYASWSFSSFWFVSLLPSLPPPPNGRWLELVPGFIWPDSAPYFQQWIDWREGDEGPRCAPALECSVKGRKVSFERSYQNLPDLFVSSCERVEFSLFGQWPRRSRLPMLSQVWAEYYQGENEDYHLFH